MTVPTITYGHGYLFDCETATGWAEVEDGNTGATTSDGDVLDVNITASAGNKTYYWDNDTDIDKSMTTYPLAVFRYKTSSSSIKAEIVLEFDDATTQTLLAETSSTTWTVGTAVPTAGKTLDHVRFHADQATGHVYYDFILFCKGQFTFPAITNRSRIHLSNRTVDLGVPGRVGDITQYLGAHNIPIEFIGNMDTWGTWGSSPAYGQYLIENWLLSYTEPWQWLTSDLVNAKVTIRDLDIGKDAGDKSQRFWSLLLKTYSKSCGSDADWESLSWLGL